MLVTITISPELLYRWVMNAMALLIVTAFIGGVKTAGLISLLLAAIVLGLVNAWVRPIILLLTLPLNIATLGVFTFVVNGLMLLLTSGLVPGFEVAGFWTAIWAAFWLTVVSAFLSLVVKQR